MVCIYACMLHAYLDESEFVLRFFNFQQTAWLCFLLLAFALFQRVKSVFMMGREFPEKSALKCREEITFNNVRFEDETGAIKLRDRYGSLGYVCMYKVGLLFGQVE